MNHARLIFPYIGMNDQGETTRNWITMNFKSEDRICKRRIKRMVRRWGLYTLERQIHSADMRLIMRRVEYI